MNDTEQKESVSLLERLIFKLTSGRFIFTVVVAGVYAYLAITSQLDQDRINEITLIVLYAYFNINRPEDRQAPDKTIGKPLEDIEKQD